MVKSSTGPTRRSPRINKKPEPLVGVKGCSLSEVDWIRFFLVVGPVSVVWYHYTDTAMRISCFLAAFAFAVIEPFYVYYLDGKYETTVAQFIANVFYTPLTIEIYSHVVSALIVCVFGQDYLSYLPLVRVLVSPFNIWTLEIIQGTAITFICGRNVAWHYTGPKSRLNGLIKISMYFEWWMLGAMIEVLYWPFFKPVIAEICRLAAESGWSYAVVARGFSQYFY